MARQQPGIGFSSSGLVRILSRLALAEAPDRAASLAEQLGQWLDLADATSIYTVLHAQAGPAAGQGPQRHPLQQDLEQLRSSMGAALGSEAQEPNPWRIRLPQPGPQESPEQAADFTPYHRYYLAWQREMENSIPPLRARARAQAARGGPVLQRLAALDASLEQILAPRERQLLGTLPLLLARRFAQAREAAGTALDGMQPGGWLRRSSAELQAVLQAELEFRLLPVTGLIEAIAEEENDSP